MNEFNKLVTQTEENRNLLCLLNNKVDSLLKRFDKLEGKFCTTSVVNQHITPPASDSETFKAESHVLNSFKNISFSDSSSEEEIGEFKDAIQEPPLFMFEKDDFKVEEEVPSKSVVYSGSLYYSYTKSKSKRISSMECKFKNNVPGAILEIKRNDGSSCDDDLQVICGIKAEGIYELEERKGDIRLVLLKIGDKAAALELFNGLND
ncbi:Hypothetical protein SRAE_1000057600 [Strongyloides ratti]|uniref:Uncharacterized protein n=1 Tax=Strongyloides ratti TaxID=34506 RepID=A0A090MUM3_STRRB|nr:Hypothetical protein SRAE_1000057600 [Strongyloides ratti]CEF62303.1 Hypothetical protein SRAE_1000057600 [Strongyloides ratti]